MPKIWLTRKIPLFTIGLFCLFYSYSLDTKAIEPISSGNPNRNEVALTCNVFWGEEFLLDMLKTLENEDVIITFFIGGTWAEQHPELLKEIVKQGHEIANHSYNHPHPNKLTKEQNKEQILKTEKTIQEIANTKTFLYSPPYGEYNTQVLEAATELEYKTIVWSIDTVDWKKPPPDIIVDRVMKKLHPGAIVLMHPTEPTQKALERLIKQIKQKQYTFVKVSDIIN